MKKEKISSKKILSVLLAILMIFSTIPMTMSYAAEIYDYCGPGVTFTFDDETGILEITSDADVDNGIIDEYKWWYAPYRDEIETIIINEGIIGIGEFTFSECEGVKTVVLPESLTFIGESAFHGCISLESIVIPTNVKSIGNAAFDSCVELKSVTLPEGLETIGWGAFGWCVELESIEIPSSVTAIDGFTFESCWALKDVVIPESVTEISDTAFKDCKEGLVIKTVPGAYAETFAEENNIAYEIIGCVHDIAVYEEDIEATCTEDGVHVEYTYCTLCEEIFSVTETVTEEAFGHTPGELAKENEIEATCKAGGSYDMVVRCAVCDEILEKESFTTEKLSHIAAAPVKENVKAAVCEEGGEYDEVVYCELCGEELGREKVIVDALGHTPAEVVREVEIDPTCVCDGRCEDVIYCETCGEELSREVEIIPATGHKDTTNDHICNICGEVLKKHSYKLIDTVEATCTTQGYKVYECELCGTKLSNEYVEPLGHTLEEVAFEYPTCTKEGKIVSACACGYTETEILDKTPHTFDMLLMTVGLYDDEEANPYEIVTAPTCKSEGYTTYICADCGATKKGNFVPKLDHNFDVKVTTPTCTQRGYTTYTCEDCGYVYKTDYKSAKGHVDADKDDACDVCHVAIPKVHVARCSWCDKCEAKKGSAFSFIYELIHSIVHSLTAK